MNFNFYLYTIQWPKERRRKKNIDLQSTTQKTKN